MTRMGVVLVVDSSKPIQAAMSAMIGQLGWVATCAPSVTEAMQRFAEERPSVVILSLLIVGDMPDLVEQLLAAGRRSNEIAIMTASKASAEAKLTRAWPGVRVIHRPPHPIELAAVLEGAQPQ